MTVLEAHIAFKIEADKNAVNIGISGCPSFLPEEIDYWLYTAYLPGHRPVPAVRPPAARRHYPGYGHPPG